MKKFGLRAMALGFVALMSVAPMMAQQESKASPQMEFVKAATKQMIDQGFAAKFDGSIDPMQLRRTVQMAQEQMPTEPNVEFIPETLAGIEAELSMPQGAREDGILIYIHGGGLICGNAQSSRGYASLLAGETKLPVYSFTYRLAPEDKFPAAVDDSFEFYKAVLAKYPGKPVFLLGESGGAYLSIVTAMKARDNGVTLPAAILLSSPIIDMSGTLNRNRSGNKDFTVTPEGIGWLATLYYNPGDEKNPYVSPYFDDMHGMPPTFLSWDQSETLAVDCEELVKKLLAQGVECHFKSYPDCFHAFAPIGRNTPESNEVLQNTVRFINAHIK